MVSGGNILWLEETLPHLRRDSIVEGCGAAVLPSAVPNGFVQGSAHRLDFVSPKHQSACLTPKVSAESQKALP